MFFKRKNIGVKVICPKRILDIIGKKSEDAVKMDELVDWERIE